MTTTANNILDEVKIYVGTYAKYNNGSIFGEWLTLGEYSDLSEFYDACKELHKDEEDPEFMFQDFETPDIFKNAISESGINDDIFEMAEALEGKDIDMISAFIDLGYDLNSDNIQKAEDSFFGEFNNYEDLGEEYANQTGVLDEVPESLKYYFDFEKYGKDLSYDLQESGNYFFWNN